MPKRNVSIRLHESLKRKDAAMLRAWKLLGAIDVWPGAAGYSETVSESRFILRSELGPDAYAESIRLENTDG